MNHSFYKNIKNKKVTLIDQKIQNLQQGRPAGGGGAADAGGNQFDDNVFKSELNELKDQIGIEMKNEISKIM